MKEIRQLTNDELAQRTIQRYYIPKKAKPIFNNNDLKKLLDKGEITLVQYKFFEFREETEKSILTGMPQTFYRPRILETYRVTKRRHIGFQGLDMSVPFLTAKKFVCNTIPWEDGYETVNIHNLDLASGRFFLECRYSKNPYSKAPVMKQVMSLNELSNTIEEYINDKWGMMGHTLYLIELEGTKLNNYNDKDNEERTVN